MKINNKDIRYFEIKKEIQNNGGFIMIVRNVKKED